MCDEFATTYNGAFVNGRKKLKYIIHRFPKTAKNNNLYLFFELTVKKKKKIYRFPEKYLFFLPFTPAPS